MKFPLTDLQYKNIYEYITKHFKTTDRTKCFKCNDSGVFLLAADHAVYEAKTCSCEEGTISEKRIVEIKNEEILKHWSLGL